VYTFTFHEMSAADPVMLFRLVQPIWPTRGFFSWW